MSNNLELIKKREKEAKKIIADAQLNAQKIKHKAISTSTTLKENAQKEANEEAIKIVQDSLKQAESKAIKIIDEAKEDCVKLSRVMKNNLEEATAFIVKRVTNGGS